jgi:hypothetical protein
MAWRKGVVCTAVAAVLASGGMVRGEESSAGLPVEERSLTLEQSLAWEKPLYAQDTAQPGQAPNRRPLMMLMDNLGVGRTLDNAGINIYGHFEGGYTYNFDKPGDTARNPVTGGRVTGIPSSADFNAMRLFDYENGEPIINQFDITAERRLEFKPQWDVGGLVEFMWGRDAALIHSNGLFDWYDNPRPPVGGSDHVGPEEQFDLTQAYLDVMTPVGNGLRFRVGKFINFQGYETINPTTAGIVSFYSRSFLFSWGLPYTYTGVLGTYNFNDRVTFQLGAVQSGEQRAGLFGFQDVGAEARGGLIALNWVVSDQFTVFVSNFTGQTDNQLHQETSFVRYSNEGWRSFTDIGLYYFPSEPVTLGLNLMYGHEDRQPVAIPIPGVTPPVSSVHLNSDDWYAAAFYAGYRMNEYVTLKGRAEWFHDDDGTRIPASFTGRTNLYEITAGLDFFPMPHDAVGQNLVIRPEIRYDWSEDKLFGDNVFLAPTKKTQWTAAVDLVFKY